MYEKRPVEREVARHRLDPQDSSRSCVPSGALLSSRASVYSESPCGREVG